MTLRTSQRVVSLIGIAILVWGIIQVTFLFLDYKNTESSNAAGIVVVVAVAVGAKLCP